MITPADLTARRHSGDPIVMVTCYDAWSARIIAASPVDCILVGDSAAMVMHGHDTTIPATVEMMAAHVAAVRRGAPGSLIIGDMPFLAHRRGLEAAVDAVRALMQAGAHAVKLEGAGDNLPTIRHIVASGVPVMGHIGLTPQSIHQIGGFRVQGREADVAQRLLDDARGLEEAGCFAVVLECVPAELARQITEQLAVPTVGIGAGPDTTGQVLVLQDLLGMDRDFKPKFLRTYLDGFELIGDALARWSADVRAHRFPSSEESYR